MNPDVQRLHNLAHESHAHGNGNGTGPTPPKLADILTELEVLFLKYVELEQKEVSILLALWVVQTHSLESFAFSGFISLQSCTPRCGKSRLLELLSLVAADKPALTTYPTAAVLFRSKKRTLILDEVDRFRNQDREAHGDLMSVLNCSFKRGAVVERVAKGKEGFVVEAHDAYRAVALAGLEKLSDTLTDRAFIIRMKRSTRRMPRLNIRSLEPYCQTLKAKVAAWVQAHETDIEDVYSSLPDETPQLKGEDDRLQDIAEGLLTLAMLADGESGQVVFTPKFQRAIQAISQRREKSTREEQLLAFLEIAKVHLEGHEEIFVETQSLVQDCEGADPLGWIETGRKLSFFLKNFDLHPFKKSGKVRGYTITREWIEEWQARYR